MKLYVSQWNHRTMITIAAALLFIAVSLTGSNFSYAGPNDPAPKTVTAASFNERMDAHFSMLHTKLQISQAQEDQWRKFTLVMMENTKIMQDLQARRQKEIQSMNALEDLKSYSEIADAHAAALKKFIPAFEALYNSMTKEQQKNADSLFLNQRELMGNKKASN